MLHAKVLSFFRGFMSYYRCSGVYYKKKERHRFSRCLSLGLSYLDSNQDKLIQSQMCYRYTIGQFIFRSLESGCKSTNFF